MAETEEKKVKKTAAAATKKKPVTEEDKKDAKVKRIIAVVFWVLAFVCELVAIMNLSGKWYLPEKFTSLPDNYMLYLIIFLVLDLIFLIIGSQFWKKANHLNPASKKNKVLFFLQNQMGLIVAIICFVPFIIKLFTGKDLKIEGKDKKIVAIVAIAALVIGGLFSWDWNPISKEDKEQAITLEQDEVYVTQFGHCFHLTKDCQSLANSDPLVFTADDANEENASDATAAIAATEHGYRLCKFCEKKLTEVLPELENEN